MPDILDNEEARREYGEASSLGSDSPKSSFNTMARTSGSRPTKTFTARMAFYFALTAIMTAAVLSVVLAVVWEGQFRRYTQQNLQTLADQLADGIAVQYDSAGSWTDEVLGYAHFASVSSAGVAVQLEDSDGAMLYDDSWTVSHRMSATSGRAPSSRPESIVSAEVLSSSGNVVGTVRLLAYGSTALTSSADSTFRTNSYGAVAAAAAVAVILACVIGYLASRALTKPIKAITSTAAQIRSGDLTARTNLRGDDEIGRLGETFDSMATELEHDIKFEHRLTSDVAHELRTPLMAMLATVEAMQDGVLPSDDEHFETVAEEVRRLSRLVDAMLHLSRIENGTRALKLERTDMVYLVKSMVSMQHQLFHEKGLHLRFDDKTDAHECYAQVDADLIREAVTNLMSNAMRYTGEGGWVVVGVRRDRVKGEVQVSVQDTGIGISKEDIPRVFSRFWRSDASRERVSGGLGVGLALTKEIVEKHNGVIGVESELGKGTTFTLRLPLEQRKTPARPQQER
nr:HAMP domain-containing sensor histidine kinase [uncultured Olsenella sp.]